MDPSSQEKDLRALEKALPSLIEKLKSLQAELTVEEQDVFKEIIDSAVIHTKVVQAHEEGDQDIVFAKPKSVHSTLKMKQEYIKLPKTLGLDQQD